MKKITALLLCIALLTAALFGCGSDVATSSQTMSDAPNSSVETTETIGLRNYVVVIPADADFSTKHAATLFVQTVKEKMGFEPFVITDDIAETPYEILIGNTNRAASNIDLEPSAEKLEYVLYQNGNAIVAQGESYMVGGGVAALAKQLTSEALPALPTTPAVSTFQFDKAKSAIIMIGDGMGFNQIDMMEQTGEAFVAKKFPNRGESQTNSNSGTTDSAAGGTALSTGYRTNNGYLGLDWMGRERQNIRELAHSTGAKTAVLSTDSLHGATPASFLVHYKSRSEYEEIRDLIQPLIDNKEVTYAVGALNSDLQEKTAEALDIISADDSAFFMMVEEGAIDWAGHSNNASDSNLRVENFNNTIAYVAQFVLFHSDVALVVTADHETGGLTKQDDGTYQYTTDDHTPANVPVYAIGDTTEFFKDKTVRNIHIPRHLANIFGNDNFGMNLA